MKRCPECRRDYTDETLNFCLDDGSLLVDGPAAATESATAIFSSSGRMVDAPTAVYPERIGSTDVSGSSIAVLPFTHLSNDPDDEHFCDGLAEELLNALAHVEGLKVTARTSSFSFKGKNVNVSEIGRELSVATVLEGSVRKSGNRLRVTTQLINTADGYQIWSERYDREMRDIFEIQDEITLAVVDSLKLKLLSNERSAVLKKGTGNAEAHELYLRGRALWSRRNRADLEKAVEYYQRAIALDPDYALAYCGLADSYTFLAYYEAYSPAEMAPKARAAMERAVELDPALTESLSSRAMCKAFFDFDMSASETDLRKAIATNPNSALSHYWLSATLSVVGRFDESVAEGRIALELDPLSPIVNASLARSLCCARAFDEAIELSKKNFEILPDFFFSHWVLGWAYREKGQLEESIHHFRKSVDRGGSLMLAHLGDALIKAGHTDEAQTLLVEIQERLKGGFVSPLPSAIIHAGLGDMAEGLRLLEQAYEMRVISLIWTKVDPVFEVFRSEPRFQEMYDRIRFPD